MKTKLILLVLMLTSACTGNWHDCQCALQANHCLGAAYSSADIRICTSNEWSSTQTSTLANMVCASKATEAGCKEIECSCICEVSDDVCHPNVLKE